MRAIKDSDIIGQRFGRLEVIDRAETKNKHRYFLCRCDCGTVKAISLTHLRAGASQSCGCGVKEATIHRNTKHNGTHTRLFNIWQGMRRRCTNEKDKNFKYYGGRGIRVAEEWNDFEPFREWSLANGYAEDLTIERINVNGNYQPDNCTWIPRDVQAKNKRNNHPVMINGETKLMTEWIKEAKVSSTQVYDRIRKGWSIEDALFTTDKRKERKVQNGSIKYI